MNDNTNAKLEHLSKSEETHPTTKKRERRDGVYVIDGKVKIGFMFNGKQHKEIYKGTLANAHKHREKVISAIAHGIFTFEKWFPNSVHAKKGQVQTFEQASAEWLRTKKGGRASAYRTNTTKKKFWDKHLGGYLLTEVTKTQIKIILAESEQENRTLVNYLTAVREVFEAAVDDDVIAKSPVYPKSKKYSLGFQHPEPEPLDFEQVDMLMAHWGKLPLAQLQVRNYFQFAIWTGLRVAELIALTWQDIDWVKGLIRVNKARVHNSLENAKEDRVRYVRLLPEAIAALKHQEQYTKLQKKEIFFNPLENKPWGSDRPPRITWWQPALLQLGIPSRDAYATRDTFASMMISKGMDAHVLCDQMGHSSVVTTMRHYATMFKGTKINTLDTMEALFKAEYDAKQKATLATKDAS